MTPNLETAARTALEAMKAVSSMAMDPHPFD
jgi:hypothetical protein